MVTGLSRRRVRNRSVSRPAASLPFAFDPIALFPVIAAPVAGLWLPDLRMNRADVDRAARCWWGRCCVLVSTKAMRIGIELRFASGAAEMKIASLEARMVRRRCWIDVHAAHGIVRTLRSGVRMRRLVEMMLVPIVSVH